MRLFLGLALDGSATYRLERFTAPLKRGTPNLRWSRPESWHVTLQFLGSVGQERLGKLVAELRGVVVPNVRFTLQGTGAFERVGIFYAAVEPTASLLALQRAVTAATARAGFVEEERSYRPHVTLARRRGRAPGDELRRLAGTPLAPVDQLATEFLLYESLLQPGGSEYRVRERFGLLPARATV